MAQHAATLMKKTIGTVRIGVAQLNATANCNSNYGAVSEVCVQAAKQGCRLLCLPECFHFIGSNTEETFAQAESITEGASMPMYQSLARDHKLWLSLGGFHEVASRGDNGQCNKVFNTHVVVDHLGKIVALYRKIHLFDVDIPGGAVLQESKSTVPGHECMVVPTPFGTLGLSTCYDLRFPELYTELVARGADIILIPSAFTVPTGRAHWHVLMRARAIETQCFVLAAAQVGRHNHKRISYGHATAVDPWGTVLADGPGLDNDDDVAAEDRRTDTLAPLLLTRLRMWSSFMGHCNDTQAELDFAQLASVRERMPVAQHRKNATWS